MKRKKPLPLKRGRRAGPPENVRAHFVGLRFNAEEYERVRRLAGRIPVSTWLRNLALDADQMAGLRDQMKEDLQRMREATARSEANIREAERILSGGRKD